MSVSARWRSGDCRACRLPPFTAEDDVASGGVWSKFPETHSHYAWVLRLVSRVSSGEIKGRLGMYEIPESSFVRG